MTSLEMNWLNDFISNTRCKMDKTIEELLCIKIQYQTKNVGASDLFNVNYTCLEKIHKVLDTFMDDLRKHIITVKISVFNNDQLQVTGKDKNRSESSKEGYHSKPTTPKKYESPSKFRKVETKTDVGRIASPSKTLDDIIPKIELPEPEEPDPDASNLDMMLFFEEEPPPFTLSNAPVDSIDYNAPNKDEIATASINKKNKAEPPPIIDITLSNEDKKDPELIDLEVDSDETSKDSKESKT